MFTLNDLLAKVGLNIESTRNLRAHCLQYELAEIGTTDSQLRMCDVLTSILLATALLDRPIQETVLHRSLNKRGILSRLGEGWDAASCLSWFDKRLETRSNADTTVAEPSQMQSLTKCSTISTSKYW